MSQLILSPIVAIRKKLKRSDPTIGTIHQRKMVQRNTRKLSKTLFLMTGASAAFWVPSLVLFSCLNFAPGMFPEFVKYLLIMIHTCNSVVNPVIYSLRMPMFRQILRRSRLVKIGKQRKKYIVNWGYFYRDKIKEIYIVVTKLCNLSSTLEKWNLGPGFRSNFSWTEPILSEPNTLN